MEVIKTQLTSKRNIFSMKRNILLTAILLTCAASSFCQDGFVDSLNKVVENPANDSQKLAAQISLAKYYYFNLKEPDSAVSVLKQSISFEKNKKLIRQQANSMYWLAFFPRGKNDSDANRLVLQGLQFAIQEKLPDFHSDFLLLLLQQIHNKDSSLLLAKQALSIAQTNGLAIQQANALIALGLLQVTAQPDSSRKLFLQALALTQTSQTEARLHVLQGIADAWAIHGQSDTALAYLKQAISIAKQNHDIPQQLYLLSNLIVSRGPYFVKDSLDYYYNQIISLCDKYNVSPIIYMNYYLRAAEDIGNYPSALKVGLECLRLARQTNNKSYEQATDDGIARLYTLSGDYRKAIFYLHQAEALQQTGLLNFEFYVRLATCYSKLNNYDSAKYYADLSYKMSAKYFGSETKVPAGVLDDLGGIYLQLGHDSLALDFLHRSYKVFSAGVDYNNYAETTAYLARYFEKHGSADSLFYYALKSFNVSLKNDYPDYVTETSNMIAKYYFKKGNTDSAYYYQSIGYNTFKKLYNQESVRSFQNLSNLEQQREEDVAREKKLAEERYTANLKMYGLIAALAVVTIIVLITYRNNRQKQKSNVLLKDEKQKVESTLSELKSTQSQLIQQEKMASLGELTAGIAHEIQNPLNFVNNFSDVNTELIDELQEEAGKGNMDEVKAIANDIKENEQKINHHGKRAGDIVKGMLQHSRTSTGVKEPTDLNALVDEYLRLSYHGLRAKDKTFNAELKTDFDKSIGKINIIPQDIGRVLLNLFNNAFYAVSERQKVGGKEYEPTVSVTTKKSENHIIITVSDNGNGIPQKIIDKIFQPFFTTKPTGQGTGLGLSLSYDIVKAHGGEIKVETGEEDGTTFIIQLPLK